MTKKQHALYWSSWNKVRKALIDQGKATTETAEQNRHEIHVKALGHDKSSKQLTNAELDRVLAAFFAIIRPGDLNAQLRQIDQDFRRFEYHAKGLIRASKTVPATAIDSYFSAMCNKVGKNEPENLNKQQQNAVIAALNIHRKRTLKNQAA